MATESVDGQGLEWGAGLQGWGRGLCMATEHGWAGPGEGSRATGLGAGPLYACLWVGRWAGPRKVGGATGLGGGASGCMCVVWQVGGAWNRGRGYRVGAEPLHVCG